jgi:hypothetical protein
MTLPSPKKRPITQPSICQARIPESELACPLDIQDSYEGPVNWSLQPTSRMSGDTVWLPAALLAALVLLATAMRAFGDEPSLKWERPNLLQTRQTQKQPPAVRELATPSKPKAAPGKQYMVRQAGFTEEEGWARSDSAASSHVETAQLESVVVRRNEPSFDLAQSPGTTPSETTQTNPLDREIELPFDGEPTRDPMPLGPDTLPDPQTSPGEMDDFDSMLQREDDNFPTREDPAREPVAEPAVDPALQQQPTFTPDPQFNPTLPGAARPDEQLFGRGSDPTPEEQAYVQKRCAEELEAIRASRIATISLEIAPTGEAGRDYPFECLIDDGTPYAGRHWAEITYMWKAAANCHKPLYFEQVHAERYGHSLPPCLQPVCSGAHFFGSLITLPYQMGLTPPNECVYPLGHYRPGNCAPYMVPAVPFTWRAAGAQAGAAVGVAGILP